MKKIIAVLLAITFLSGLSAACGEKEEQAKDEFGITDEGDQADEGRNEKEIDDLNDEYIEAILTDWLNCISTSEDMYEDLDWAISYIKAFTQNPEWGALLSARAALELSAKRIELRNAPERSASEEAYDYFVKKGADLSFVQPELDFFEYDRQSILLICETLRAYLQMDVFFSRGISELDDIAKVELEEKYKTIQHLSLSTEYLLMELDDAQWADKVHTAMQDACPQIDAARDASLTEKEQLESAAADILDELEELLSERARLVGSNQARLDLLRKYISENAKEAIVEMCSKIDGLPLVLPDPGWKLTSGQYFWTEEDGTHRYLTKMEDLTSPPENCVLDYEDTTEGEVAEYVELLDSFGFGGRRSDGSDGFYDVYYVLGDSSFVISWTETGARIYQLENSICFAPVWFLSSLN